MNSSPLSGMRVSFSRLAGAGLVAALAGCAHMEPPSGGPVDETPPQVAAVYPSPGSRNVPTDAPVVFQFTEWIDRNVARSQAFVSPPLRGRLRVTAEGDKLQVRPSEASGGFRRNTAYQVTVLPALQDLHGVSLGRAFTLRFSTGASFDVGALSGSAVGSGGSGTPMAALYRVDDRSGVELSSLRDTGASPGASPEPWRELPALLAAVDSAGAFAFDSVAQGDYALLAFEDVNANFAFDLGFEPAAVGPLSLALRPSPARGPSLRILPVDTVPLPVKELEFVPEAPADSAGRIPGKVLLTFTRPAQPVLAATASRYRLISDSAESLPVLSVGWSPAAAAWVLETAPLRAGASYRLETTGRPDFPGRADAAAKDTSFAFEASGAVDSAAWTLAFTVPAASTGLPQAAPGPLAPAREYRVTGSRVLTPARVRMLQARLAARLDTVPLRPSISKINSVTFSIDLGAVPAAGKTLALELRPEGGDSLPVALASVKIADTTELGGVRFTAPDAWSGWTFWLQSEGNAFEHPLAASAGAVSSRSIPPGRYGLYAFFDEDGDGVWNPGSLRPWKAQEPFARALDSLVVSAGETLDLSGRLVPAGSPRR